MEARVIVILGCTACGKGALARALAVRFGAEIISVDSMKVYRGMNVGTGKPGPAARAAIPHHLIDVADPWEPFSAARFVALADQAVAEIHARSRPVVAVGGTMLYFKCWYEGIFDGPSADPSFRAALRARARDEGAEALHAELARVDPEAAARIHRNDLRRIERALEVFRETGKPISVLQRQWERGAIRRPDWEWRLIGLSRQREDNNRRIARRVRAMVDAGLVEEARRIWSDPRGVGAQASQAVGYRELFEHFEGRMSLDDAIERIKIDTRHLAKQQRNWLKRQRGMSWIEAAPDEPLEELLRRALPLVESPARRDAT
ncbi:MAG: tRNA (adenosine(37)-N6)-dimethylallyltransferase MiaA [Phycisphaerae bacterium]